MTWQFAKITCVFCVIVNLHMALAVAEEAAVATDALPANTAIDDYVNQPDDSFKWKVIKSETTDDMQSVIIDMTSQTWLTAEQVDRPEWQHWIRCAVPKKLRSDVGFLMIGGGRNGDNPPNDVPDMVQQIAEATGTVVCELEMVPNQPLVFHNDGIPRSEDDLIGYTWDQYLKTSDPTWLARNAMVKSAVRAMDAVTAMMASDTGGARKVDKFVVAGGSKRGWTTWLTGAMDDRVVAIVPIVIDVLNADISMRHHFAAYGYWAPAVGNYVQHGIMERMGHSRLAEIYRLVDPVYYRHRLKMPKYVVNAAGDQFFLPDSSQFYWDLLEAPKYLRYVPNADHGLGGSDAMESITAFYGLVLAGRTPPTFDWIFEPDGNIRVSVLEQPKQVRLWQATNPHARDFRVETLGEKYESQIVEPDAAGEYVAGVTAPVSGWTAYFLELTYDVGLPVPLKLTTGVRVVPDVLPHREKKLDDPYSITVVFTAPSEAAAGAVVQAVEAMAKQVFPLKDLSSKVNGTIGYLNWRPDAEKSREQVGALTKFLGDQKCDDIRYQLESGLGITTTDRR